MVAVQEAHPEEPAVEIRAKSHSADAVFVRPYVSAIDSGSLPLAAAQAEMNASAALQPRSSPAGVGRGSATGAFRARLLSGGSAGLAAAPLSTPAGSIAPGSRPERPAVDGKVRAGTGDGGAPDGGGGEESDSLRLGALGVAAQVLAAGSVDSDSGRAVRLDTMAARRAAVTPGAHSAGSATLRYLAPSPGASPLAGRDYSTGAVSGGGLGSTNDSFRTSAPETTASTGDTGLAGAGLLVALDEDHIREDAGFANGSAAPRASSPQPFQFALPDSDTSMIERPRGKAAVEDRLTQRPSGTSAPSEVAVADDDGPRRHIYQPPSDATAAGAIAEAPPLLPMPNYMIDHRRKPS